MRPEKLIQEIFNALEVPNFKDVSENALQENVFTCIYSISQKSGSSQFHLKDLTKQLSCKRDPI